MGGFASAMSLLPGRNPAGTSVAGDYTISNPGSSSGANPILSPTNPSNIGTGSTQTNPYVPGSVVPGAIGSTSNPTAPAFGANSGGYSPVSLLPNSTGTPPTTNVGSAAAAPIGGINEMSSKDLTNMFNSLKSTFGDGPAHAIMNFLVTGAGFNQDAINNLFAALQPGYNRSQENLLEQFSATGNRFGSGAQIGLADLMSQENLNMGEIESQMYEQSVNDYINTLLNVSGTNAQRKANSPSVLDQIGSALQLGGSAAGGASSIISALNPTADTGLLDAIAGFAL